MDEQSIFGKMVDILKAYTKDPALLERATMDTHILNDLKVNSARLVDVIIKCEDGTIGDAVAIIQNKLA